MDDLISRQWLMECVDEGWIKFDTEKDTNTYIHLVRDIAPSAQRWIPCSERLPEDEEDVIVSVRDDSGDNTLDYSSCGWYACAGDFWVVDNEANERVVAWMPLPDPWKGGQE